MTADTLPPLPEPADHRYKFVDYLGREVWESGVPYGAKVLETQALYTADQLRAAVLAERERIARQVEDMCGGSYKAAGQEIAAAIRATSQENEQG
jgi:hypothetical protein